METLRKWLTVKEACEILDVSERSIYNFFSQGKLTEYRDPVGKGPVRLLREEVENFFRPKQSTEQEKLGKPA